MNIEWDYGYYQAWSDNKWLVDKCCRKYLQTGLSWNVGAFAIYSFANQWIRTISY